VATLAKIVLGNSTSYRLDLLAHGLDLREGDEVLLAEGDFPATIYPWLPLKRRGIRIKTVPAPAGAPEPDDLRAALTKQTKVVCTSWVFSFTGRTTNVQALAKVCRDHGDITFVLNGSQAVGARPTDVRELGIDALVCCGFKWLLGPYATGFAWLSSELLQSLRHEQGYWLAQVDDISSPPDHYELRGDLGAAAYDVFCTANLSTYPAWERALSLLLDTGLDNVEDHDQALVQRLIDGLPAGWQLRSPTDPTSRSTLVFIDAAKPDAIGNALRALDTAGIDVGERARMIRISPHVHNTARDIDRVLEVLADVPTDRRRPVAALRLPRTRPAARVRNPPELSRGEIHAPSMTTCPRRGRSAEPRWQRLAAPLDHVEGSGPRELQRCARSPRAARHFQYELRLLS
jgi:cysteine desulfurase/selenocysteine lyase